MGCWVRTRRLAMGHTGGESCAKRCGAGQTRHHHPLPIPTFTPSASSQPGLCFIRSNPSQGQRRETNEKSTPGQLQPSEHSGVTRVYFKSCDLSGWHGTESSAHINTYQRKEVLHWQMSKHFNLDAQRKQNVYLKNNLRCYLPSPDINRNSKVEAAVLRSFIIYLISRNKAGYLLFHSNTLRSLWLQIFFTFPSAPVLVNTQDYLRLQILELKTVLLFKEINYKIYNKAELINTVFLCVKAMKSKCRLEIK